MSRRCVGLLALALLLAGCGSSGAGSGSANPPASPTAAGQAGTSTGIRTQQSSLGTVLANASDRTLYLLTADKPGGAPTCTGSCLGVWPPVIVTGVPGAPSGVSAQFGTVSTAQGRQLTVDGYPAYTYVGDSGPQQVNGENIVSYGGTWYALGADGKPIKHAHATTSPSPSAGGGYGY